MQRRQRAKMRKVKLRPYPDESILREMRCGITIRRLEALRVSVFRLPTTLYCPPPPIGLLRMGNEPARFDRLQRASLALTIR